MGDDVLQEVSETEKAGVVVKVDKQKKRGVPGIPGTPIECNSGRL
jgi:hypothetical protein